MESDKGIFETNKKKYILTSIEDFVINYYSNLLYTYFEALLKNTLLQNRLDKDNFICSIQRDLKKVLSYKCNCPEIQYELINVLSRRSENVGKEKTKIIRDIYKSFKDYILKNKGKIFSYEKLEILKKEVYLTNDFLEQIGKFFKGVLESFLLYYYRKSRIFLFEFEKKYVEHFFKIHKNILSERIKSESKSI